MNTEVILPDKNELKLKIRVSELLLLMGADAGLKGFSYLCDAIIFALKNHNRGISVTKDIYPAVACANGVKPLNVERTIRHLIANIWLRNRMEDLNKGLGLTVCRSNDKLTNGEFIALVSNRLSREFIYAQDGCFYCIDELYGRL